MEYQCISADGHIDLAWLPPDLFVSNAAQALKDRMPYVTKADDGMKWVTKAGAYLGYSNGKGAPSAIGGTRMYVPGQSHRPDRVASTGLYTEAAEKGICRPTTPELRLKEQDRDGIQAEVMYGLLAAGNMLTDNEAAAEFYRIYNDWLANFCSYDRKRLVGLASIPTFTIDAAVTETRRVSKLGVGGLDFSVVHGMLPLWNPNWDPFWKAASDANLPVHFHTIGSPKSLEPPVPDDLPKFYHAVSHSVRMAGFQLHTCSLLASIINGGVLERFPKLKVVMGESGIGWIPYVLERMDEEYENRFKRDLPLKMKPSEYWRRQCRATFQKDLVGAKLLDEMGAETVMWGSDYPHGDCTFPDSQDFIKRQFAHLPKDIKYKVSCENAGKFYGLM